MSKVHFTFFLLLILNSACSQNNTTEIETEFRSLSWLVGIWERTNVRPGQTASETWQNIGPYELKGVGITKKGNDTIFLEKIQIRIKENKIYYVADVRENKEPVYFEFTNITNTGFVCENPAHDFPKKIEYRLNGINLTVVISGDGKSQNYLFVKR
jgi:hypothetical protein